MMNVQLVSPVAVTVLPDSDRVYGSQFPSSGFLWLVALEVNGVLIGLSQELHYGVLAGQYNY